MKRKRFLQYGVLYVCLLFLKDESYISSNAPKMLYIAQLQFSGRDHLHQRSAHSHPNLVEWLYIVSGSSEYEIANVRAIFQEHLLRLQDKKRGHALIYFRFVYSALDFQQNDRYNKSRSTRTNNSQAKSFKINIFSICWNNF